MRGKVRLRLFLERLRNLSPPVGLVLAYHRISDAVFDPHDMCVSPRHFEEHLEILRKWRGPMRLKDLVVKLRTGSRLPKGLVVTLDDGYADNWTAMRPLLERHDVPATVFAVSGCVDSEREFWWDDLERILLQPGKLPPTLNLDVNGEKRRWELGEDAEYGADAWRRNCQWRFGDGAQPTRRHTLYRSLYRLLRSSSSERQNQILDDLSGWACLPRTARATHRILRAGEIHGLMRTGLVDLGAHTLTHPDFSLLDSTQRHIEINGGKERLEEITGSPVTDFAFPYGVYSEALAPLVRDAGFTSACSSREGPVWPRSNVLHLPRLHVGDCDGEAFARTIASFL